MSKKLVSTKCTPTEDKPVGQFGRRVFIFHKIRFKQKFDLSYWYRIFERIVYEKRLTRKRKYES